MDFSLASRVVADLRPPLHPVKVLPTQMVEAERLSRTRAAVWLYGSATLLTLLGLELRRQPCCRKPGPRKDDARAALLEANEENGLPTEDEVADEKEQEAELTHRLTVGFVVYHMTYTYLGLMLVFWACRRGYLNVYGLDWELYSFWFLESIVTHVLCRASSKQFLRSICPIFSERYDLVKDTVSIGIYANLDDWVGHVCAAVVVLTMIVPNINNYMDPVAERLSRISYWPPPIPPTNGAPETGSRVYRMKVFLAKQVEEATREHRRMLCLLEDLPQLAVALFFTGYSCYMEGASISPFILVNIVVALGKTICVFAGRPICLTWMAMNKVPWPLQCISDTNVNDVVWITSRVGDGGDEWKLSLLKEIMSSEEAARAVRQAAEHHLWDMLQATLAPESGFPLLKDEHAIGVDLVRHAEGQVIFEAVIGYCASSAVTFQQAQQVIKKWEIFSTALGSGGLLGIRAYAAAEGNAEINADMIIGGAPEIRPLAGSYFKRLSTGSLKEQEQAIKFLAWSNSLEAAWAILSSRTPEIFRHRDRVLRLAACRSMALVEWEEFGEHAEALAEAAFEDEDDYVCRSAWTSLALKGSLGVRHVQAALSRGKYFDRDDQFFYKACFALEWLGTDAEALYQEKLLATIQEEPPDKEPRKAGPGPVLYAILSDKERFAIKTLLACGYVNECVQELLKHKTRGSVLDAVQQMFNVYMEEYNHWADLDADVARPLVEICFDDSLNVVTRTNTLRSVAEANEGCGHMVLSIFMEKKVLPLNPKDERTLLFVQFACFAKKVPFPPEHVGALLQLALSDRRPDDFERYSAVSTPGFGVPPLGPMGKPGDFPWSTLHGAVSARVAELGAHVDTLISTIEDKTLPLRLRLTATHWLTEVKRTCPVRVTLPVKLLVELFGHESIAVRSQAINAFKNCGTIPESLSYLPQLAKCLEDTELAVRNAACNAFSGFDAIPCLRPYISTIVAMHVAADQPLGGTWVCQQLDVFRNDLVGPEEERLVLARVRCLSQFESGEDSFKAALWAKLLRTDQLETDIVKGMAWLTLRKAEEKQKPGRGNIYANDQSSIETAKFIAALGKKGRVAMEDLLRERPKDIDFNKLLTFTIDSIKKLEPNDPRLPAVLHYVQGRNAASSTQQACWDLLERSGSTGDHPALKQVLPLVGLAISQDRADKALHRQLFHRRLFLYPQPRYR